MAKLSLKDLRAACVEHGISHDELDKTAKERDKDAMKALRAAVDAAIEGQSDESDIDAADDGAGADGTTDDVAVIGLVAAESYGEPNGNGAAEVVATSTDFEPLYIHEAQSLGRYCAKHQIPALELSKSGRDRDLAAVQVIRDAVAAHKKSNEG